MNASFEQYVLARGGGLLRFAYLLCGDHHLAEDLVQETLARAHRRWDHIESEHPDAYLRKAIFRAHVSWWRRRSNRESPSETLPPEVVEDFAGRYALRDELWQQLATLSRMQRAVLVLKYFEDLDDEAISRIVGCAPSTARVHAHRGLAALRSRLSTPLQEAWQ